MLTDGEIGLLFRYISSTVHPKLDLPFSQVERRCLGRSKQVVKRYLTLSKNPCKKTRSSIWWVILILCVLHFFHSFFLNAFVESSYEVMKLLG
ncbi:unnamed protein product [Anisakis simplex]|uniref:Uncharacterized protein n=1 Tax=Anisakis simplex TaxID=6269 RepID=A0A0M3JF88_ANISI|nr:unnamed protein product [Anisakis simplex]